MRSLNKKLLAISMAVSCQLMAIPVNSEEISDDILKDVPKERVVDDLQSHFTEYLRILKNNKDKRKTYIEAVYSNLKLEELVKAKKIDQSPSVLRKIENFKIKAYLDEMVISRLEELNIDVEILAEERYQYAKEKYKTRKRIKTAIIYIEKKIRDDQETKKRLGEFLLQLKEKSNNSNKEEVAKLFFELAKEHSEEERAEVGGVNDKWYTAPSNIKGSTNVIQKIFELEAPGDITEVIESRYGYQIFMLVDVRGSVQQKFENVKESIVQEIRQELWSSKQDEIMKLVLPSKDISASVNDKLLERTVNEVLESRLEKDKK